jgi:hypothetical protein
MSPLVHVFASLQEVYSFLAKASKEGLEVHTVAKELIPKDMRVSDSLLVHLKLKSKS